jgi:hypothetical protein
MLASDLKKAIGRIPFARRVYGTLRRATGSGRQHRAALLRALPRGSVGMEIGVHVGDYSQQLLDSLAPRELHLVDPWELSTDPAYAQAWYGGAAKGGAAEMDARFAGVTRRFAREIAAGIVTVHRSYSSDALAGFPDGHFDWIYIDGNHTYEFVRQDLLLSERKIKPGGLIAGDDYGNPGWWEDGVTRAVDDFVRARGIRGFEVIGDQFLIRLQAVPIS